MFGRCNQLRFPIRSLPNAMWQGTVNHFYLLSLHTTCVLLRLPAFRGNRHRNHRAGCCDAKAPHLFRLAFYALLERHYHPILIFPRGCVVLVVTALLRKFLWIGLRRQMLPRFANGPDRIFGGFAVESKAFKDLFYVPTQLVVDWRAHKNGDIPGLAPFVKGYTLFDDAAGLVLFGHLQRPREVVLLHVLNPLAELRSRESELRDIQINGAFWQLLLDLLGAEFAHASRPDLKSAMPM